MLSLHLPSLSVMMITACFALSVAIFLMGVGHHRNLLLWSAALAVQGLAYVLFGLKGSISDMSAIVLGNAAMSAALALITEGVSHFQWRRLPRWRLWAPVLTVSISSGLLLEHTTPRILFVAFVLMAQCILLLRLLQHGPKGRPGRGQYLLTVGTCTVMCVMAFRMSNVLATLLLEEDVLAPETVQNLMLLMSLVGILWLSVGLLMMNKDRAEQALQDSQAYEQFRSHILELLSGGTDARALLEEIVKGVEALQPGVRCSVLLVQPDGVSLGQGVAPSLPDFFNKAIDGLPIGPGIGCCGTAAYTGERVVVADIGVHPYGAQFRELAKQADLASCWSQPIWSSAGKILGTFAIYHQQVHNPTPANISLIEQTAQLASIAIERGNAADQLKANEHSYRQLIHTANEGISVIQEGKFRLVNSKFCDILGQSAEQLLDQPFMQWIRPQDQQFVAEHHQRRLHGGIDGEVFVIQVDTRQRGSRWIEVSGCKFDWHGKPSTLNFVTDVTDRLEMEARIRELAYHDTLTGLPNRRLLDDRLSLTMSTNQRTGNFGALMFLDMDNFKPVNDTHGHGAGDQLLVEAAQRLQRCIRASDTVARFGGDEFVVLLNALSTDRNTSVKDAESVAQKILVTLSAPYVLNTPGHDIKTVTHHCTVSIGITLFLPNEGEPDDFLVRADSAMYAAKEAGRSTIRFHAG